MNDPYCKKNTIAKAASLARGDRLDQLYSICESQKSISTNKLVKYLDQLHESMQLDAIHFKRLAEKIGN